MHHHNRNPVYFTLIPSHDCDDINLQMFCWYSCSLYFKRSVVPSFVSNPNLEYIFCQQHVYRLRPYSISPRYVSTCVVAYWPKCHLLLCVYSSFITPRGSVYYVNAPTGRLKPIWLFPRWFFATINSYIPQLLKFHRYFTVEGALVARRWPSMPISAKAEISWLLCCGRKMSVNG